MLAFAAAFWASRVVSIAGAFPVAEDDDDPPDTATESALAEAPKTENGAKRRVKLRTAPVELLSDVAHRPGSAAVEGIIDGAAPGGPERAEPGIPVAAAAAGAAAGAPGFGAGARRGAPWLLPPEGGMV